MSVRLKGSVTGDGEKLLAGVVKRLRAPFEGVVGKTVGREMKASVLQEFQRSTWRSPGGDRPWKPLIPFGTRRGRKPFGGQSGALASLWKSARPAIAGHRVELSISSPWAHVHRGGSGTSAREGETVVRAKQVNAKGIPKMFYALGLKYGVWISPKKLLVDGLRIPARPFATANPTLIEAVKGALLKGISS